MGIGFLFQLLAAQLVVIAVIVFVLKKILDKKLIETAVIRLENFEQLPEAKRVDIRSHQQVKSSYKERIHKAVLKNFSADTITAFKVDRSLMGGIIITLDDESIDCSLRDRLKQAFGR